MEHTGRVAAACRRGRQDRVLVARPRRFVRALQSTSTARPRTATTSPPTAKGSCSRALDYQQELGDARIGDMLFMNGTDHQMPQPWIGLSSPRRTTKQDDFEFVHVAARVPAAPIDRQPAGGHRRAPAPARHANILIGVASNRVDVRGVCGRRAGARRRAEPLTRCSRRPRRTRHGCWGPRGATWCSTARTTRHAACSQTRSSTRCSSATTRLARSATHACKHTMHAAHAQHPGTRRGLDDGREPTARTRSGLVEGTLPGDGPVHFVGPDGVPRPTQVIEHDVGEGYSTIVTGQKVRWVLDLMRAPSTQAGRSRRTTSSRTPAAAPTASTNRAAEAGPATSASTSRN